MFIHMLQKALTHHPIDRISRLVCAFFQIR